VKIFFYLISILSEFFSAYGR